MTSKNRPPRSTFGQTYTGDGVSVRLYADGSGPALDFFPVGTTYNEAAGVNERLHAQYRREGKMGDGRPIPPTNEGLLLNERAVRLHYSRGFEFAYTPFHVIAGDLGRLFPPQPWAAGVLPIIPVERVLRFCEIATPSTPRTLFEYDPKAASTSPMVLRATIVLLAAGWAPHGTVPLDWTNDQLRATLGAMGLEYSRADVEEAVQVLKRDGIVDGIGEGPFAMLAKPRPGLRFKSLVGQVPLDKDGAAEAEAAGIAFLRFLWSAFEPFVLFPSSGVRFDPGWWKFVIRQGWEVPSTV